MSGLRKSLFRLFNLCGASDQMASEGVDAAVLTGTFIVPAHLIGRLDMFIFCESDIIRLHGLGVCLTEADVAYLQDPDADPDFNGDSPWDSEEVFFMIEMEDQLAAEIELIEERQKLDNAPPWMPYPHSR